MVSLEEVPHLCYSLYQQNKRKHKGKETAMDDTIYDHYIAIDWSIKNMAIARMTKKSNIIKAN